MFSVVITTKDRLDFLTRAFISICDSSETPIDLVIVNDGGATLFRTDLPKADFNVIIHNNQVSKGANYSRNLGIELATTEIIFLLDDDDAFTTDSFSNRLKLFKDKEVGVVYTGAQLVSDIDLTKVRRVLSDCIPSPTLQDLLTKGNVVGSTSRVAVRKSHFTSAGKFDESLNCLQDYDLWLRMSMRSKILYDGKAGILYTIHSNGNQISSNYLKYLETGEVLLSKYDTILGEFSARKKFRSRLYFRVSLSASGNNEIAKYKFACLSFFDSPNIKSLIFAVIPTMLLKRLYSYV
ncbi:glycosyltransferase family A protein [Vibrio sp. 10N.286.51.F4]|uniref:glycosyltransferase family A protein n=1 Tax=Vibrio sp. 10N.286.51.F4 TaxID=3229710 RepID=UPI00354B18B1